MNQIEETNKETVRFKLFKSITLQIIFSNMLRLMFNQKMKKLRQKKKKKRKEIE